MDTNKLLAAQQYVSSWLVRFDDELFGILYRDINDMPKELATQVFEHKRSVSIYGVRGIGKTTLMQAILWHGLQNTNDNFLPINVGVSGANNVLNQNEIEDKFYRAVLSTLISVGHFKNNPSKIKSAAKTHAPWLAASVITTLGIIFPPIAVGSSVTQKAVSALLSELGMVESGARSLAINKDIEPKMAVDFIIEQLEHNNIHPIFVIDELDKVRNNQILSEFFNGNQAWFQEKRTIISLSHTFGQSVEEKIIESLGRFSQAQKIEGITTVEQFKNVLNARLLLGISKIESDESKAFKIAKGIVPNVMIEEIVNRYVPNSYLMLEHTYRAIQKALLRRGRQIIIDDLEKFESTQDQKLTGIKLKILEWLSEKPLSPKELIEKTKKNRGTITRCLHLLYLSNLIEKIGRGKNVKYTITQKGDAARHRNV